VLNKKKIVIFGGSKGIGKAIVAKMESKQQFEIVEISRTSGYDLLKTEPSLPFDKADIFIYCTGLGLFYEKNKVPENINKMIKLNLEIPILLTNKIRARHYIFIGSNSSYYGFDGSEVYCAVKHGILGFARALRRSGKKVTIVSPGAVNTSFWDNSGMRKPKYTLTPEDVADAVTACIENKGDIEELLITPHNYDTDE
jgi:short-subunit dehydrogenase